MKQHRYVSKSALAAIIFIFYFIFIADAQNASALTLTRSGDRFAVDGQSKFLVLVSYFDAMDARDLNADLNYLQSKGIDGLRIFPVWADSFNPTIPNECNIFGSDGAVRPACMTLLRRVLDAANARGMIVDISFSRDVDMIPCDMTEPYRRGVTEVISQLWGLGYRNIFFDFQNERNGRCDSTFLSEPDITDIRNRVRARVGSAPILSASEANEVTPEEHAAFVVRTGLDIGNYHDPRGGDWWNQTFGRVGRLRTALPGKPVYFGEPERCIPGAPCQVTAENFITAVSGAKRACAAAWTFHTEAGFWLNTSTFQSNLDPVESNFLNSFRSRVNAATWCEGGGPIPSPPPGGPPFGRQYNCPAGYIWLAGANASGVDTTETAGFWCDEDAIDASVVREVTYPVTGILRCTRNDPTGKAFVITDNWQPCNAGRPGNPGWEFINGRPHKNGVPVRFIGEVSCPGTVSVTIEDDRITAGAWTQNPSTEGIVCIRGTDRSQQPTPTPTPRPQYIYYVYPDRAPRGATVIVTGDNLDRTVQLTNSTGGHFSFPGTINSARTEVTFVVPRDMALGTYTLRVGPTATYVSNPVPFTITPDLDPPVITGFSPTTVGRGGTLEIYGTDLAPNVQFFSSDGQVTTVVGWVNGNQTITTVVIPAILGPGQYTVGITSPYGSARSTATLVIVETGPGFNPSAGGIVVPTSTTTFQQLIGNLFGYALIFVGIAVFVMIVWAGLLWMTSAANPGNIALAKHKIFNAIIGAILLLSSYVILYTINPDLVRGTFRLPAIPSVPGEPPGPGTLCPRNQHQRPDNGCAGCVVTSLIRSPGFVKPGVGDIWAPNPKVATSVETALVLLKEEAIRQGIANEWRLTEAYCPTSSHRDQAHYNGHAVDIAIRGTATVSNVKKLCTAARNAGFTIRNEYLSFGAQTAPECPPPPSEGGTGPHLHLNK